jgi:hypothetical protein
VRRARRPLLLLALAGAAACAPRVGGRRPESRVEAITAGDARFRLVYLDEDREVAGELLAMLPEAVGRTRRWGDLREPVTITIHPTHDALEAAVSRAGYRWLRAWARYDSIELQSPRTWSWLGPSRADVLELLVHELAHCVTYQGAGTARTWADKDIPLWFREGLASVTAAQGYRRIGPDAVARFYEAAPAGGSAGSGGGVAPARGDPLADPEPLYRSHAELVYATAHLAFEFLLVRYGEERIRAVLAGMRAGDAWAGAFRGAIGIEAVAFEREFRRYLQWEGWR